MKPTSQILQTSRTQGRYDGDESPSQRRSTHPQTDWNFQAATSKAPSAGSFRTLSRRAIAPGFRDLSNEFLGAETTRNYVAEVLFFAIIVGVSTWPIVSMVRALADLVK